MATWPNAYGYCTSEDVLSLFPNAANFTNLSEERVVGKITDASVHMDAQFSRFYVVPISADAAALQLCGLICKYMAAALIHRTYMVAGAPNSSQGKEWLDYAQGYLNQIVPPRASGVPGTNTAGAQPQPTIRFFTAPQQSPTELPDFPDGAAATFNTDDDGDLNPDKSPYFRRDDRMPWQGGLI